MIRIFSLCCCLLYAAGLVAQDYNYVHYTTRDGLAGETLYTLEQDADGFMWFATETGLSRFDGHKFRNFTVADGLPSNETFGFYEDRQLRLWIKTFSNEPCYYYKGKIYNKANTPALASLVMPAFIKSISETRRGEIIFIDETETAAVLEQSGKIRRYGKGQFRIGLWDVLNGEFETNVLELPASIAAVVDKYPVVYREYERHTLIKDSSVYIELENELSRSSWLWYHKSDPPKLFVRPERLHVVPLNNEDVLESYRTGGAGIYNCRTGKKTATFLPGLVVNGIFKDRDGHIWLGTKWNGLYKLSNERILNLTINEAHTSAAVQFVQSNKDTLFASNDNGAFYRFVPTSRAGQESAQPFYKKERIYETIGWLKNNASGRCVIYNGSDFLHLRYNGGSHGVKSLFLYGDTLLAAIFDGVFRSRSDKLRERVKIHEGRATCAAMFNGDYYVGTLHGLYIYSRDGQLAAKPLTDRISYFVAGKDGEIWVSTYDNGIYGLMDHKVVAAINMKNSLLSSNLIRCIFYKNNNIWAGTDKGINKISIADTACRVTAVYNVNNGLSSDIINTIFVDSAMVYAGTAAGLNIFSNRLEIPDNAFNLVLTQITEGDKTIAIDQPLTLPHNDNRVSFYFSGISFSTNQVMYQYRLLGLSDQWQRTTEQSLSFIALPSGKYTLQIQAFTSGGNKSVLVEKNFEVAQSVLEYWWVRSLLLLLAALILCSIVYLLIRQIRKTEADKRETYKRMVELEQMALRAQMNPHFIFNCLNSVQDYILRQDAAGANLYLAQFAGLVRQTLENSPKLLITLQEEITYLRHYIELERLQVNFPFDYEIRIAPAIVTSAILMPNMIVQPFIENSLKHGLRKREGKGDLAIDIQQKDDMLIWTITDNGPGIDHVPATKVRKHRSSGIPLVQKRISTLNLLNPDIPPITFKAEDLAASGGQGTRVVLVIPVIHKPVNTK